MASSKTAGGATGGRKEFGTVIGIDLGTTFSCVGVYEDGQVEIIANDQGNRTTPSYVAFSKEGERLIGEAARNQLTTNPENTVFDVKRLIGRSWDDPMVQKNIQNYPFKVINKNSKPYIQLKVGRETKTFAPEEISAMVLGRMKKTAEEHIGEEVTHAVVTVPAYFNDAQRQATKDAAMIADLKVLRILNEPTAAAITHTFRKIRDETILVFDLGGGKLDVTLLKINDKNIKVLATNGNTNLGGADFDQNLVNHCIASYESSRGVNIPSARSEPVTQSLRLKAEEAKRKLSINKDTQIEIDSLFKELITRDTFEKINLNLFKAALEPIRQTLHDARIESSAIDDLVFVGGSSRIPKLQEMIMEYLNDKTPRRRVNADESAAVGAALLAASFSAVLEHKYAFTIEDISTYPINRKMFGDVIQAIIPRYTPLPAERAIPYTAAPGANIYEGTRLMGSLTECPTVAIDENGILTRSKLIAITTDLRNEEIMLMKQQVSKYACDDETQRDLAGVRNDLEAVVYTMHDILESNKEEGFMTPEHHKIAVCHMGACSQILSTTTATNKFSSDMRKWKCRMDKCVSVLMEKYNDKLPNQRCMSTKGSRT